MNHKDEQETESLMHDATPTRPQEKSKLIIFVMAIAVIGLVSFLLRDYFSLDFLAQKEAELRYFRDANPVLIFGAAFLLYVMVTGFSLPGAAAMSLVYAWFFGFWPALILISFASTLGATIAFLMSRYLLRESIQSRFGERLKSFNKNLETEGAFYLFTLRLIPAIPFFVINLVMGLTPMRAWTFWWISQIGMLPGTAVFVYAGSSVPSLQNLADRGVGGILNIQILVAFVILGAFPLAIKFIVNRFKRPQNAASDL